MKNLSPRKVLTAMIRAQGVLTDAARMLHTQPRHIARVLDENPELQDELDACHTELYELALKSAKDLLEVQDREMTKFVLDRLGEKRGLRKPKKQVQIGGDAKNPIVTETKIDLTKLSDEELAVFERAINKEIGVEDAGNED